MNKTRKLLLAVAIMLLLVVLPSGAMAQEITFDVPCDSVTDWTAWWNSAINYVEVSAEGALYAADCSDAMGGISTDGIRLLVSEPPAQVTLEMCVAVQIMYSARALPYCEPFALTKRDALAFVADIYISLEDYDKALAVLDEGTKSMNLSGDFGISEIYHYMYMQMGQYELALLAANQMLSIVESHDSAWLGGDINDALRARGQAYLGLLSESYSSETLQMAIDDYIEVYQTGGCGFTATLEQLQDFDNAGYATVGFNVADAHCLEDYPVLHALAQAYAGHLDEALAEADALVEDALTAIESQDLYYLREVYARVGRPNEDVINEFESRFPGLIDVLGLLED
jgi:hypothetical protein